MFKILELIYNSEEIRVLRLGAISTDPEEGKFQSLYLRPVERATPLYILSRW
jgi:hypothetical protein